MSNEMKISGTNKSDSNKEFITEEINDKDKYQLEW